MVPVTPLLDLVRERVAHGLAEARQSTLLSHLGVWLGVLEDAQPWEAPEGLRQYNTVAEAAIVCAASDSDDAQQYFAEGIEWLQRRRFFVPGEAKGLEADPLACLALAAGILAHGPDAAKTWLTDFVTKAIANEHDRGRGDLFRLTSAMLGNADHPTDRVSPLLAVACARRLRTRPPREHQQKALAVVMSPAALDAGQALFHGAALRELFAIESAVDLAQPTIEQVASLLRGIPAALKRWPWEDKPKTTHKGVTAQRWDIQHEYHVQSLVWAILRPVFPGLEDEENLPSLGHKHPRADILVPGLRLVIELKYLREATQAARASVIEGIAADTALYRTPNSGYDTIIALVWDATASSHHHAELESGIRKLQGIAAVIIVSRPGEWT